jgi:hypothetical protein
MKLPDSIMKRDLLYGPKGEKADLSAYGDAFFEARRFQDAFLFYERAKNDAKLRELRKTAIADGNLNILGRMNLVKGHEISAEEWAEAAQKAFESGKLRYAAQMFERAGMIERAAEVRAVYEPPPAAPAGQTSDKNEQGAKKGNAQDKSAHN